MKRQLTPEQQARRNERRAQFKALWKKVADMPETERISTFNRVGFVNPDGHTLSLKNTCLLALQCPGGSVFGGFRQWLAQGRCVRKGEHGHMIWCPTTHKTTDEQTGEGNGEETRFIIGTVFDINQTDELAADRLPASRETEPAHAAATGEPVFA